MGKDMNRHFTGEDKQKENVHLKRCATSSAIREMQIKTTVRYYCIPIRKVKIKTSGNTNCWWGWGEAGSLTRCWCERKWHSHSERVWQLFTKLNMLLPYDPGISLLDIIPEKWKLTLSPPPHTHSKNVRSISICNSPKLEATQTSFSGWMVKQTGTPILLSGLWGYTVVILGRNQVKGSSQIFSDNCICIYNDPKTKS